MSRFLALAGMAVALTACAPRCEERAASVPRVSETAVVGSVTPAPPVVVAEPDPEPPELDVARGAESDAGSPAPEPAMDAAVAMLQGSYRDVLAALERHGAETLDAAGMDGYDLASPRVVATERRGARTCFALEARAGLVTTRTYEVCWVGDRIVKITDKGMR